MKKPKLLERFSVAGRLRHRLTEILDGVATGGLPRVDAGDRLKGEFTERPEGPADDELRSVLFEAEMARADLYQESAGATALDVAGALDCASKWHDALPADPIRSMRLLDPTDRVITDLREMQSRRTAFRMAEIFLSAADESGIADGRVERVLTTAPAILCAFLERAGTDRTNQFLTRASRLLQQLDQDLGTPRTELFRMALQRKEALRALSLWRPADKATSGDMICLGKLLAQRGTVTPAGCRFIARLLSLYPEVADIFEKHLLGPAAIGDNPEQSLMEGKLALNEALATHYPDKGWPLINLARAAAWVGDDRAFLAHLIGAWARGWRPGPEDKLLVEYVWSLGFGRAVDLLLRSGQGHGGKGDLICTLREVESLLETRDDVDWRKRDNEITDGISGTILPQRVLLRVHHLRARVHMVGGAHKRAMEFLTLVTLQDPGSRRPMMDLLRSHIYGRQFSTVRDRLEMLDAEHQSREMLLLWADLLQAEGTEKASLEMLEKAADAECEEAYEARQRGGLLAAALQYIEPKLPATSPDNRLCQLLHDDTREPEKDLVRVDTIRRRVVDLASELGDTDTKVSFLVSLGERKAADRETLLEAARALIRANDEKRASRFLQRLLRRDDTDPEALSLKGLLALKSGRLKDAEGFFRRCCDMRTAGSGVAMAMATVQALVGDVDGALATLRDMPADLPLALRVRSSYLIGALMERQGRIAEAMKHYGECLALAPHPEAQEARGRLAVYRALSENLASEVWMALLGEGMRLLESAEGEKNRHFYHLAVDGLETQSPGESGSGGGGEADISARYRAMLELLGRGDLPGALNIAEERIAESGGVRARHHHALILHELAFDRELCGNPSSPAMFSRAHEAWQELMAHPRLLPHLRASGLDDGQLKSAARQLRHDLVGVHISLALRNAESDSDRAAGHVRLVGDSALVSPQREQMRCNLYMAMTEDLDPTRSEDAALLERRLEVLLHADPRHPEALAVIMDIECRALIELLSEVRSTADVDALDSEVIATMEERLGRAACAVGPLLDEVELYGAARPEEALQIGVWHLADAVVKRNRDPRRRHELEPAPRAREWLERVPDMAPQLADLARELESFLEQDSSTAQEQRVDTASSTRATTGSSRISADPRLEQVRGHMDTGEWNRAEEVLLDMYPDTLGEDAATDSREVVDLFTTVRARKKKSQSSRMVARARALLEGGRNREVLGLLGQIDTEAALDPGLLDVHIRALLHLGDLDKAREEMARLESFSRTTDLEHINIEELNADVACHAAAIRLGNEFAEAREKLDSGDPNGALKILESLPPESAGDTMVAWLKSSALAAKGAHAGALRAIQQALEPISDAARTCERRIVIELSLRLEKECRR